MDTLAPDEAVVPMIMSKILVAFEGRIRFRWIVAARRRGHDRCTGFKIERDKVLEANGMAGINTRWKTHGAAALVGQKLDPMIANRPMTVRAGCNAQRQQPLALRNGWVAMQDGKRRAQSRTMLVVALAKSVFARAPRPPPPIFRRGRNRNPIGSSRISSACLELLPRRPYIDSR